MNNMNGLSLSSTVVIIFLLRVLMGLRLVFPGWFLIRQGTLSSRAYLEHTSGPFAQFFKRLASNRIVDYLNKYGLFLIGLCLVFGVFVRPASIIGIVLMIMYWFSKFPHKDGIIDERLVYIGVFLMLILVNAGIFWGYDYVLLQIPAILNLLKTIPWMEWLL